MKHLKECSFCKKQVYRLAKGLCPNCYYRQKRNGSPAYQDRARKPCTLEGCTAISVAKGYCDRHYRQYHERGEPTSKRFEYWGHADKHPLHQSHSWAKRQNAKHGGLAPEWHDFWRFVEGVGDRPSPAHRLVRKVRGEPLGPNNFEWKEKIAPLASQGHADRAAYARAYRIANPRAEKNRNLRKSYGIELSEYEAISASQGGMCAICGGGETSVCHHNKRLRPLAVDHCHTTGKVRGLLCSACNRALGGFKDSPEILRAAIAYLEKHQPPDHAA